MLRVDFIHQVSKSGYIALTLEYCIRSWVGSLADESDVPMSSSQTRLVYSCNTTVVPTKSDSDVILCLQLLSKTRMRNLHLS